MEDCLAHHAWRSFGVTRHDARAEAPLEEFYRNVLCQNQTQKAHVLLVGHNHFLEHVKSVSCGDKTAVNHFLSGSGAKLSKVAHCDETHYASQEYGFNLLKLKSDTIEQFLR